MALETVVYPADLIPTNPAGTDAKSQGDDHIRNIKSALRTGFGGFTGPVLVTGVDGGAVNAYTLTPAAALPAYGTKMLVEFTPTVTNTTTAPTLNISALGAKVIKSVDNGALLAGDLVAGTPVVAVYDGVSMRLLGPTKNYIDQLSFASSLPAIPSGSSPTFLRGMNGVASFEGIQIGDHAITVTGGNGMGSVIDKARRFATVMLNVGTAITYADSATNGGTFTINETGFYAISYIDSSGGSSTIGVFSNAFIQASLLQPNLVCGGQNHPGTPGVSCSGVALLAQGDYVRGYIDNSPNNGVTRFSIRKIGT